MRQGGHLTHDTVDLRLVVSILEVLRRKKKFDKVLWVGCLAERSEATGELTREASNEACSSFDLIDSRSDGGEFGNTSNDGSGFGGEGEPGRRWCAERINSDSGVETCGDDWDSVWCWSVFEMLPRVSKDGESGDLLECGSFDEVEAFMGYQGTLT